MCLHQITRRAESIPDKDGPECGWKVFMEITPYNGQARLAGPCYQSSPPIVESRIASVNWFSHSMIKADSGGTYQSGFHIYLNRRDAVAFTTRLQCWQFKDWEPCRPVIRKVSYWGQVVYGTSYSAAVAVAENMLIHSQTESEDSALVKGRCEQ